MQQPRKPEMTVALRMPENWQDFEDLEPPPAVARAMPAAEEGIAGLVDRLLQSLEDILAPAGGNRRARSHTPSASPAQRLALLRERVDQLPQAAREVLQPVMDQVTQRLLEIRRLGGALQDAVRESDEARRQAEQLAMTDALTGLLNRHGFSLYAHRACAQAETRGESVLLLFVDIDQMKQINDHGGHEAGDRAIQVAAEALRRSFRSQDLIVRWGGDEFAVLSVGGALDLQTAAQRIVRQAQRVCVEREVTPAVSLSVGGVLRQAGEPINLDALMACADHAMYRCKQARPSCTVTALKSSAVPPIAS